MAIKDIEPIPQEPRITPEAALAQVNHLPVAFHRNSLRDEIRRHPHFVLVGETGSGKTTCLPLLLEELMEDLGLPGKIAVTQPRRLAATSITHRVSSMVGTALGDRVGYHIRFENQTNTDTNITFMTDGILLRKLQYDPYLLEYSIVMIDEAHERSLNIDLCLGLLLETNRLRKEIGLDPIRVIVSSATLERNKFASFISPADPDNSVMIEGKIFPVSVFYDEKADEEGYNFISAAANKVADIVDSNSQGDILIFMPGKREIADTIRCIESRVDTTDISLLPLHAELTADDQNRIFEKSGKRKIIVATNIAEASVTIDGIVHVIDSGLIKQTQYDPRTGIERLVLIEHALSGLEQRKGRAGRTAPGYCYRLFTEQSLRRRPAYLTPEIQRSNLSQVVLTMKKCGIHEVSDFRFLDKPDDLLVDRAVTTLMRLGALDDEGIITPIGEFMTSLGLEPHLARMIYEAASSPDGGLNEIVIIASFLNGKNIFLNSADPKIQREIDTIHTQFVQDKDSDFLQLLSVWQSYAASGFSDDWAVAHYLNDKALAEAKNVRLELIDYLSSHGLHLDPRQKIRINKNAIGKALVAGLIENLLVFRRGHFSKLDRTKNEINVHPASSLRSRDFHDGDIIIAAEIFSNPENRTYADTVSTVKPDWLPAYAQASARKKSHHVHGRKEHRQRHLFDRGRHR